jgi:hypothetical protein
MASICVYCGGASDVQTKYLDMAFDFGAAMAESNLALVYGGGGTGLMGRLADGVLSKDGSATGIMPLILKNKEAQHKGLTEFLTVPDMHTRKRLMVDMSEASVVLPGGLGTLEEFFEIYTWRKLGIHQLPILLFNAYGYWDPLLQLIRNIIDEKFTHKNDDKRFIVVETIDQTIATLQAFESKS